MPAPDTATLLEEAADRIGDISRAELQIMLRRAALCAALDRSRSGNIESR
jgi:hypothetical protein